MHDETQHEGTDDTQRAEQPRPSQSDDSQATVFTLTDDEQDADATETVTDEDSIPESPDSWEDTVNWGPFYFMRQETFQHVANCVTPIDPEMVQQMKLPPAKPGWIYVAFLTRMRIVATPSEAMMNYQLILREQSGANAVMDPNVTAGMRQADYPVIMPAPQSPFAVPESDLIHAEELDLVLATEPARTMILEQVRRGMQANADAQEGGK